MSNHHLLAAVVALGTAVSAADGQISRREDQPPWFERRVSGSVDAWVMQPTGELRENIGKGIGVGGAGLFRLDHSGALALRADVGIGGYGEESKRVPLSPTIGGRIQVDVTTRNYLFVGGIGPQLTLPYGIVRPYVNAGVAFQVFFTESDVDGSDDSYSFASTTNQSDWTPALTTGGGVYVPLRHGRVPVLLDLGFTWYAGGRATYLKPGSIEDLPNSQIRITAMESATPFILVRLGVKIGR